MITVHHLENSRSLRIIWLLEELGLDYEVKHYKRNDSDSLAPPDYKKLHKLGKAPVITDGDEVYAETGAIVDYIIDTYGKGRLRPKKGTAAYKAYNYWFHAAEGSLMPYIVLSLLIGRMETEPPFFLRPIIKAVTGQVRKSYLGPSTRNFFEHVDEALADNVFLAGAKLSAADIMMSFPLEAATARAGLDARYPNVQAYLERLHPRPAYQAAIAKGGELNILT